MWEGRLKRRWEKEGASLYGNISMQMWKFNRSLLIFPPIRLYKALIKASYSQAYLPCRWSLPCWFQRIDRSPFSKKDPVSLAPPIFHPGNWEFLWSRTVQNHVHLTNARQHTVLVSQIHIFHTGLITGWIKHQAKGIPLTQNIEGKTC